MSAKHPLRPLGRKLWKKVTARKTPGKESSASIQIPPLPNEIWCQIVREAFKKEHTLRICHDTSRHPKPSGMRVDRAWNRELVGSHLLRVNRLFLTEGRPLLYGKSLWFQEGTDHLQLDVFMRSIGIEALRAITNVQVNYDRLNFTISFGDIINKTLEIPNLHTVTIRVDIGVWDLPSEPVMLRLLNAMATGRLREILVYFYVYDAWLGRYDEEDVPWYDCIVELEGRFSVIRDTSKMQCRVTPAELGTESQPQKENAKMRINA